MKICSSFYCFIKFKLLINIFDEVVKNQMTEEVNQVSSELFGQKGR